MSTHTGGIQCPQCGSKDVDYNGAGGNAVCVRCGCVLEENIIVSEITFQDTTGGQTSVVGQFVPATGMNSIVMFVMCRRYDVWWRCPT